MTNIMICDKDTTMSKNNIIYVCSECGNEFPRWSGKCLGCGAWNSLKEFKMQNSKCKMGRSDNKESSEIVSLDKIKMKDFSRISTKIGEMDRVLGGGIVPGSVILLGGDPGIGKSTLMLDLASKIQNTVYISGEESAQQIKIRADRLGIKSDKLHVLIETDIDNILSKILNLKSEICIIDSIQSMYDGNFPSTPGSLVQVRECALKLQQFAKNNQLAIFLVGHVTKEGNVAGPRTLEHLVDVVLYLEGERYQEIRILRGVKNRFGATDEIGIFEMTDKGLIGQTNPSKLFLAERSKDIAGSIVTAVMEGTRPFLVEIQALTTPTIFGFPKRTVSGFDLNRLNLLIAVLTKRAGLNLSSQDIYLNVAGGFRLKDPGADLAVSMAIASAFKNKSVENKLCLFGEVGLSGEIRSVSCESKRQQEAKRLGFTVIKKQRYLYQLLKDLL